MEEASGGSVKSVCEVAGCTGGATTSRWIAVDTAGQRRIEVCWKHAEGPLDPASLLGEATN